MSQSAKTSLSIDLGSRMTKVVRLDGGRLAGAEVFDTGHDPLLRLLSALLCAHRPEKR
jgi:hypothetical protein